VEEFVWRKPAIQLYLNITSIDIAIITRQELILESKEDKFLKIYKNPYNNKNPLRAGSRSLFVQYVQYCYERI